MKKNTTRLVNAFDSKEKKERALRDRKPLTKNGALTVVVALTLELALNLIWNLFHMISILTGLDTLGDLLGANEFRLIPQKRGVTLPVLGDAEVTNLKPVKRLLQVKKSESIIN